MRKSFLPVWVFARIAIRRAFRDKVALFFIFAFPLIFLFVFGGIFSKHNSVNFKVSILNDSTNAYAKKFVDLAKSSKSLKVDAEANTLAKAKEKMSRGQLDATITLPQDFGEVKGDYPSGQVTILYTQNNQQAVQVLAPALQAMLQEINAKIVPTITPFTVTTVQLSDKSLSAFDYTFAGLLGFSIVGLGIFGPVNVFPELKKQGVLRRLHTTPLKVWQYFMSNVVSQSTVGLISLAMQFVVAIVVFDLKVSGNIIDLAIFLVLSIVCILGIGLAIGGWAKNERQAAPLSNIVVFPMLFLSGTFFPRFAMPEWLQKVSAFLPLTPVIDGIRLIATEGKTLFQIGPQIGLIAIWIVIIYAIAFRTFRWE